VHDSRQTLLGGLPPCHDPNSQGVTDKRLAAQGTDPGTPGPNSSTTSYSLDELEFKLHNLFREAVAGGVP